MNYLMMLTGMLVLLACGFNQPETKKYQRYSESDPEAGEETTTENEESDSEESDTSDNGPLPEAGQEKEQGENGETELPPGEQDPNELGNKPLTFAAVQPTLEKVCGGGNCHSAGARFGDYVSSDELLKKDKTEVIDEMEKGDMPPRSRPMNADEKKAIIDYVNTL